MLKRLVFYFVLWIPLTFVSSQQSFSLTESIVYALENSATVNMERLNVADADGQILELKSIGIPTINGSVEYQYFLDIPTQLLPDFISPAVYGVLFDENILEERTINTGGTAPVKFGTDQNINVGLSMQTMLFDITWIKGLQAQKLYRKLVLKQVTQKEYEVRSNVTKAYLAVLIAHENMGLLQKNIDNLEKVRSETQAIFESGFAEKLDVERLDFSLENLKSEQENIGRLISISKNMLKFQMGYPIGDEISLSDNFDQTINLAIAEKIDLEEPIDFNNRPGYQAILQGLELQEINEKVINLGKVPSLRGFASYSQILQRDDLFQKSQGGWFPTSVVGLTLDVPIFDGFNRKARLQRAKIQTEKTIINKQEFERGMTLSVQNGRVQYINARQTVQIRQRALDLAQRIYDTAQIKYREGVGSSLERTLAEADLYTAQNNYINALYDLVVAKTDLEIALGKI